jgi:hypothetical protein
MAVAGQPRVTGGLMGRYEELAVANLQSIGTALERIADTLDDYMDMSLSAQGVIAAARDISDPEASAVFQPVVDVLEEIRARRNERARR